jgi:apolipoprotein N-acyltransferase
VAHAANNRVIAYVNELVESGSVPQSLRVRPALAMLHEARAVAASEAVTTLLDTNITDLQQLAAYIDTRSRSEPGQLGCLPVAIIYAIGAVASWWLVDRLGVGPVWPVVVAVAGGFLAVGLVAQVVEFFQALVRR